MRLSLAEHLTVPAESNRLCRHCGETGVRIESTNGKGHDRGQARAVLPARWTRGAGTGGLRTERATGRADSGAGALRRAEPYRLEDSEPLPGPLRWPTALGQRR